LIPKASLALHVKARFVRLVDNKHGGPGFAPGVPDLKVDVWVRARQISDNDLGVFNS
jgi:hypothetical protein